MNFDYFVSVYSTYYFFIIFLSKLRALAQQVEFWILQIYLNKLIYLPQIIVIRCLYAVITVTGLFTTKAIV